MITDRLEVNLACVGKVKVSARALPVGNSFCPDELGVLIMERARLEEHVSGGAELGEHHDMLEFARRETGLAPEVEQRGHSGQTVSAESHLIRREADEVRVNDGVSRGQTLAVHGVITGEEIDRLGPACAGEHSARVVLRVQSLGNHVVDGPHDKRVSADCHSLLDFIEQHGDESVELGRRTEGLLDLTFGDGAVDFERSHLVEELGLCRGLVEHVRVVGRAVDELPILGLDGLGHFGADFFDDGSVLPRVHEDGGSRAAIRAVDEDYASDVVD